MSASGPQLAAVAVVLAVVAQSLPCARSLEIGLCLGTTLFFVSPRGSPILFRTYSTIDAAASVRAIRDVNNLNCTILGDGCEDLVSLPGDGEFLKVQPYFINPRTMNQVAGPVTLLECQKLGGHALLGLFSGTMCEAASLLSHSFQMPVISHAVAAPHLSDKGFYQFFARTAFSAAVLGKGFAVTQSLFGWKRTVLVHESDNIGYGYMEAYSREAADQGIIVQTLSVAPMSTLSDIVGMIYDPNSREGEAVREDWRKAIRYIRDNNFKVVHLAMAYLKFLVFTNLALDMGIDTKSILWSASYMPSLNELAMQLNDPADPQANNQTLRYPGALHGMMSLEHGSIDTSKELQARLAMHLSDFKEEELTSCLRGPDGTPDPSLPPNFMPTLRRQFIATNETTDVALNAYDMVWAAAAAFAGAARAEGGSKNVPSGVGAMKALPQISFQGASGFVSFYENGDRSIKNHQLEITNLVWDEAELSYSSVIVGVVRFGTGEDIEIELNESPGPVLTWPDGSKYPEVPGDGTIIPEPPGTPEPAIISSRSFWLPVVIGLSCSFALLVAAVAFCVWAQITGKGKLHSARHRHPPQQGQRVTLAITDIHGSTTLWDTYPEEFCKDIILHHEAARARLKEFGGYEVATVGDSFICAFHTANDAISWSVCLQLDLLCAPWSTELESGGEAILSDRQDWANCSRPTVGEFASDMLSKLVSRDEMLHVRGLLAKGKVHAPVFDTRQACKTAFSQEWRSRYGPEMCCIHSCAPEPLPIFRGLRVRIGIHSGIAEDVKIHTNTKRVVYGGDVAAVAKAVADAPCGGQIIISGETLAEVESMQALSKAVAEKCAGWRNGSAADDATAPAGMSVMHLGTHVIMDTIEPLQEMDDPLENPDESCEGPMPPLMFNNKVQPSEVNAGSGINSTAAILRIPSVLTEGDSVLADVKALRKRPGMILPPIDTPAMNISELILRSSIDATIMKEVLEDDDDTDRARPFGGARASAHTALPEKPNHEPVDASIFDGTRTHELAMVAPWPLMQRVLYFPPPTTKKRVTPPWHEAPEALGVTILFTKIEDTKKIKQWGQQTNSRALTRAISVLQRVARACLAENNGYEMEESEGDFVACFRSPANALNFSTSLQLKLVKAPWDSEVLMTWWGCEHRLHSGMVIFRGPRVAVGMCTGDALRAQPSDRTGRVEYYGPLMNHTARVAMAAHGGQILLHESTWHRLSSSPGEFSGDTLFWNMGKQHLKGIANKVFVIQAIPDGLQGRDFPPLKSQPTWKGFSSNGSFKMTLTDGSLGKYSALLSKESPKAPPVDAGSKKKKLLKKQAPAGAHAQDVCNADTLVEVI